MNRARVLLAAAALPLLAAAAPAQSLRYLNRSGGYGTIGYGGGNFDLACDSGCVGGRQSSSGAQLMLGRHVSQRLRLELGFNYQSNRETASNLFRASLGGAYYLLGGLHVRGAATYQRLNVEETGGTFEANGGPGFLVGAGWDWYFKRTWALTPYVSFSSASLSSITMTNGTATTSGRVTSLNVGVSVGRVGGVFECTSGSGSTVRLTRRNRIPFLGCLNEVEQRYGQGATSGIKR